MQLTEPELPMAFMAAVIHKFGRNAPIFTDKLAHQLSEEWKKMPPPAQDKFLKDIMRMYMEMKEFVKRVMKEKGAGKRAKIFHHLMDNEFKAEKIKDVTCKRGCGYCCHLNVDITNDEAKVLKGLWDGENRDRLEKQAKIHDYEAYPQLLSWQDSTCVFLKNNECSVYEFRPMACRTHFSATPPELCDPIKHPHGLIALLVQYKVELLKTLLYELGECDNMARQLLKNK